MVKKNNNKNGLSAKTNNFFGKINLDNEKPNIKTSLYLHQPALNKQSTGSWRGMVCRALLVCRVKSSPNKRCHWSRMSTVRPANRAANKGHYSSRRSIVSPTKLVIARSRMSSTTGASSSSTSLRTLDGQEASSSSSVFGMDLIQQRSQAPVRGPIVVGSVIIFGLRDRIEELLELAYWYFTTKGIDLNGCSLNYNIMSF